MPTLTADAALSSEFSIDARTAFVFEQEAILDPITGTVKATGTGTWAALAGTNTARQITLPETLSAITDIYIQPKAAASYTPNLYVSATATSEVVIPVVKSKTSTPTFALYGIDNEPRDAVVDIMVTGIPRMVMEGNNLFVIQ